MVDKKYTLPAPALPEWLPASIAKEARSIFARTSILFDCPDDEYKFYCPRLTALVTDERMESVWSLLEKELCEVFTGKITSDNLDDWVGSYLCDVLRNALSADAGSNWWQSVPTKKTLEERIHKIHLLTFELRDLLDIGDGVFHGLPRLYASHDEAFRAVVQRPFTMWDVLDRQVQKCASSGDAEFISLLRSRGEATSGRFWSTSGNGDGEFLPGTDLGMLGAGVLLGDLPEELALLEKLTADSSALPDFRSMKESRNSHPTPIRVYVCVLSQGLNALGLYVRRKDHGDSGFAFYSIVATIANVVLRLTGERELQPDAVRKMVSLSNSKNEPERG